MGLDMYAYKVPESAVISDFEYKSDGQTEFFYWRKHHDLHGLMEKIWVERRMQTNSYQPDVPFNCEAVRLHLDDLSRIEKIVTEGTLPATTGFFFGNSPPDDDSKDVDLEFIQMARNHIDAGYAVYYSSWW